MCIPDLSLDLRYRERRGAKSASDIDRAKAICAPENDIHATKSFLFHSRF